MASGKILSQKEYLQKYLTKGKKRKKAPKISSSSILKRSQIIDDNDELNLKNASIDAEEYNFDFLGEDAPQVAGIVDDRPPEVKAREYYDERKWKGLSDNSDLQAPDNEKSSVIKCKSDDIHNNDLNKEKLVREQEINKYDSDASPPRKSCRPPSSDRENSVQESSTRMHKNKHKADETRRAQDSDSDVPVQRKTSKLSVKKKTKRNSSDSDVSNSRSRTVRNKESRERRDSSQSPSGTNYNSSRQNKRSQNRDWSPSRKSSRMSEDNSPPPRRSQHYESLKKRGKRDDDSDQSPPRKSYQPPKAKRKGYNSDHSPPSKSHKIDKSVRKDYDSDQSLPRKSDKTEKSTRKEFDSDQSPPRKSRKNDKSVRKEYNSDQSPPRKSHKNDKPVRKEYDSDQSPPRKSHKNDKSVRKEYDSDQSPPRKSHSKTYITKRKNNDFDQSHHRKSYQTHRQMDSRKKDASDSDQSLPRYESVKHSKQENYYERTDPHSSKKYKGKKDHKEEGFNSRKERSKSPSGKALKLDKTLDGKRAGLQSAHRLKEELNELKRKEDIMFKEMSGTLTGEGAATVMRDRKTGLKRDLQKEKEEERKKAIKTAEHNAKYAKWGKGLKQVEETEQKIADVLLEMSKPLARYADDDDLDKYLKSQEREGDPMLDYIRQKQGDAIQVDGPNRPKYKGSFMPNRFGIPPGHRWDGVDRSNGYEKQWFEHQTAKKAREEEAYKWSTSDM